MTLKSKKTDFKILFHIATLAYSPTEPEVLSEQVKVVSFFKALNAQNFYTFMSLEES